MSSHRSHPPVTSTFVITVLGLVAVVLPIAGMQSNSGAPQTLQVVHPAAGSAQFGPPVPVSVSDPASVAPRTAPAGPPNTSGAAAGSAADQQADDERKYTAAFKLRIAMPGTFGPALSVKIQSLRIPLPKNLLTRETVGAAGPSRRSTSRSVASGPRTRAGSAGSTTSSTSTSRSRRSSS